MEFISIKSSELIIFLSSDIYKNSQNIPITELRAISQSKNPRLTPEDILLIVAIDDSKQIIGYIGALPEQLACQTDIKIAWNTCWWVDKRVNAAVSLKLLVKFSSAYNNNFILRDMTPTTEKIIMRLKTMTVVKELRGIKYFTGLYLHKKYFLDNKIISIFLKLSDFLFNFFFKNYLRIFFYSKSIETDFTVEYINKLNKEDDIFISDLNKNELFRRGANELNWIKKYPWITHKREKNNYEKRYFFSSVKNSFKNEFVRVKNKTSKSIVAIIFFKEINGNLQIPYIYYKKSDIELVTKLILNEIINKKYNSFFTFNDEINEIMSKKNFYFHKIKINNKFVVPKKISHLIPKKFNFQDGEGDFVFA